METRWAIVDGINVELPTDCTVSELRDALRKPADAALIAVIGDLVSVVHNEDKPLSDLLAGCAETYYFRRDEERTRNDLLAAPELEIALDDTDSDESTFQRPGINQ